LAEGDLPDRIANDLMAAGRGDREAFRRVYRATGGKVLAICLSITRDRPAAEDLMQEAFIKIWQKAASYDCARARPMSWMGTIARNTAIDWYRSKAGGGAPRTADPQRMETLPSETEPADSRIIRQQSESEALRLVGELSDDVESDIRTIYLQGLTYSELAERDCVPLGTLKSRVRRALISVRARLSDD
jgi:RNA polymerase sigma-70 factor (ECF subfamily)